MTRKESEIGSITLPPEIWRKLRERREEVGVPISVQIRKAVEVYLNG